MSQIDDTKLTPEEEAGLKKVYGEAKRKYGPKEADRFFTLTKDDATAKQILKERMKAQRPTPLVKPEEVDWENFPELDGLKLAKHKPSGALWDALEQFVQLKDSNVEAFKKRYPNFLPAWFYPNPLCVDAKLDQQNVPRIEWSESERIDESQRDEAVTPHVWAERINAEAPLRLGGWRTWRTLLRQAWRASFHLEYVAQLVSIPTAPPQAVFFEVQPVCDAQRAVLAIMVEPWRARFCPRCGLRFVARNPADKYRPGTCFEEQRLEVQRAATKRYRQRKRAKSSRKTKR